MPRSRSASEIRLVNGSTGDPVLFIDYPGRDDAILFDAGENASLGLDRLGDLGAVFITHHHVDHFIGLDRIVRANLDRDKTTARGGFPSRSRSRPGGKAPPFSGRMGSASRRPSPIIPSPVFLTRSSRRRGISPIASGWPPARSNPGDGSARFSRV